jgi:hypothetical protein
MTAPDLASKDFAVLRRPSEGFLFIVTYGRSGSTLLQSLLNTIPGYCIRGENANALYHICRMIDVYLREPNFQLRADQLAGKSKAVPAIGTPADPWYGLELVDVERTALRFCNVFCREILNIPNGTKVAGFKEIRYFYDLNFLPTQLAIMQRFFPKARILFLTRDPTEVANSSWWRGHDKTVLLPKLEKTHEIFADYAATHPDCFTLDYAAFAQGAAGLAPLYDFLGEQMDGAAVTRVLGRRLDHMVNVKAPKG